MLDVDVIPFWRKSGHFMIWWDNTQSDSYFARMVEYLERDQIQSFKEAFDSFDSNDNGKVSSHCLQVHIVEYFNEIWTSDFYWRWWDELEPTQQMLRSWILSTK